MHRKFTNKIFGRGLILNTHTQRSCIMMKMEVLQIKFYK